MDGSIPKTMGMKGVFVTATDTGVGKTAVGAAVAGSLRSQGIVVRVRKPIESGGITPVDAMALQQAAGRIEPLTHICQWPLLHPLSPERAAFLAGIRLTLSDLTAACSAHVERGDFLLVEGAGGFLSPLAPGVRNAELAVALGLPVLLVVPDRLGCINHALLTVEAVTARGLRIAAIILNRCGAYPIPGMDNAADLSHWLEPTLRHRIYPLPELSPPDPLIVARLQGLLPPALIAALA